MNDLEATKQKLLEQSRSLDKQQEELKFKLGIVQLIQSLDYLPKEGSTVSYKLGKVLLDTRVNNVHLLPQKLLALRAYAKHRKGIIELSSKDLLAVGEVINDASLDGLLNQENKQVLHNQAEFQGLAPKSTHVEKDILPTTHQVKAAEVATKRERGKRIVSVLALTNESYLPIYKKMYSTYLLMENNTSQVQSTKRNLFIIDSVWSSIDKNWEYALLSENLKSVQAKNLFGKIKTLKEKGLVIIFVYREREEYYEKFKPVMNEVDFIFTTNLHLLNKISSDFPNQKVALIPNSVDVNCMNPSNPTPFHEKSGVCYIGEYTKDFNDDDADVLDRFLNSEQKIISCYYKADSYHRSYNKMHWNILDPSTKLTDLACLMKRFKFSFYAASKNEKDISQKIIDSLACGIPVICNRNSYLENSILKEVVIFVDNIDQIADVLKKYQDNRWEYARYSHRCYRFAVNNFSPTKLKACLEREINDKDIVDGDKPLVSIIMASMREQYIDRIVTNISRQSYKNKEFIIVTQGFSQEGIASLQKKLGEIKELKHFQIIENNTSATLGERQNQAASHAKGSLLAKFDDDDFYFENYLSDMILPFKFGNYDLVGKAETFIFLEALNKTVLIRNEKANHREMEFVAGPTFVIKKATFDKLGGFMELNQSEDSNLLKRLKEKGGKIYSSDSFNFVQFRSKNVTDHTWQQKAEAFANSSLHIGKGIPTNVVSV